MLVAGTVLATYVRDPHLSLGIGPLVLYEYDATPPVTATDSGLRARKYPLGRHVYPRSVDAVGPHGTERWPAPAPSPGSCD
jgi:hypothetical protein